MSHACHRFWKFYKTLTFCSLLTRSTIPCACHAKQLLNVQKWREHVVFLNVFNILTSKCASRHNGVHFFDIATSKSSPKLRCFCTFWLGNVLPATTVCTFSTSQLPKVLRRWGAFSFFTCKCASRHNGVHFFDIATSKSGPMLRCFVHLDFEMCFAPQRRALSTSQLPKSGAEVLCTFWLGNVLRATTACNFSSLIWPAAGSAPAALASLLFDPLEPQTIGMTQCFATFPAFRAPASSFFDSFSSLIFSLLLFSSLFFCSTSAFHLSILSEVWLLNFLRQCMDCAWFFRPTPLVCSGCFLCKEVMSDRQQSFWYEKNGRTCDGPRDASFRGLVMVGFDQCEISTMVYIDGSRMLEMDGGGYEPL